MSDDQAPGREALEYEPSKVSWATAEFISRPPSRVARAFLYVFIATLAAALIYAYSAKVPIAIEASGALTSEEDPVTVRAPVAMTVANLHAEEEQRVEEGDPLVEPRTTLSEEDFEQIRTDYERLQSFLERDETGDCGDECTQELRAFAERAFVVSSESKKAEAVDETLSPIQELLRRYVVAKVELNNVGLKTQGLRRKMQVARNRLKRLRESDATDMLGKEIEDLETQIANARSEISKVRGQAESKVEQLRSKLKVQLGGLMAKLENYRTETSIEAPRSGTVANLTVGGAGELIKGGGKILDIIPEESKLLGKLMVANRDINEVQEGLDVKIDLAALPEREFGAVWGTVTQVPVAPEGTGRRGRKRKKTAARYPVIVELKEQKIEKDGEEYPFRLGMQFEGVVITEYESLLERGIRKLLKIKDDVIDF